jgi:hypothetical protein
MAAKGRLGIGLCVNCNMLHALCYDGNKLIASIAIEDAEWDKMFLAASQAQADMRKKEGKASD